MSRTYDVYGVGHALVDIQYSVSADFLARLGIEKGVMTLIGPERQQTLLEALQSGPVVSASGGSAANTMIGVAGFGGQVYYACLLGRDEWGDFYQQDLQRAGVGSNPANRVPGRTGQCLVFVTQDADRTLNTFLGVSSAIGPDHLQEEVIADSRYVYLEGYLLSSDSGFAACRRAQQLARRHGTAVSLTLSDPFMVDLHRERFADLIAGGVELLFCNEAEALAYTGSGDLEAACQKLTSAARIACVTCGAAGALLRTRDLHLPIAGFPVQAVDTTGAGDLFAGGVLFGLTHGYSLGEAGKLGAYAAAQVVAQYGPRLNRFLKDEIGAILAR
jgi:sugar/nucleoside kinase (ribokinase family)